ncbi:hypothetical protein LAZ67_X002842 [Cordylochernes scorpioides]|uniref:Helix-turn-helix domain-containing protein n=1 Tax=Cordylochernes scorpioides TaxID=51811 RepID=A0ABY6LWX6_9ARAC|nr:hypothetical protein LAZ67_X002842 [Cordylochernes scorpioides]
MNRIINRIIEESHLDIILWKRYIDDVLCITEFNSISNVINFLNNLKPFLKFTNEIEENGILSFLDIKLTRTNNSIKKDIYRKPTHTGSYLNFKSFGPINNKISVIKTLSKRILTHYSQNIDVIENEREILSKELQYNEYPKQFIKRHIYINRNPSANNSQGQIPSCILPYAYGIERIGRTLKKYNINIRYQSAPNLRNLLRYPITKRNPKQETRSNLIYRIPCQSCTSSYIGETGKTLIERLNQHRTAFKNHSPLSLLVDHEVRKGHMPDFDNLQAIAAAAVNEDARVLGDLNISEESASDIASGSVEALGKLLDRANLVDAAAIFDAANLPTRISSCGSRVDASRLDRVLLPSRLSNRVTRCLSLYYKNSDHRVVLLQIGEAPETRPPCIYGMLRLRLVVVTVETLPDETMGNIEDMQNAEI